MCFLAFDFMENKAGKEYTTVNPSQAKVDG
jgi:hypothetical protein